MLDVTVYSILEPNADEHQEENENKKNNVRHVCGYVRVKHFTSAVVAKFPAL